MTFELVDVWMALSGRVVPIKGQNVTARSHLRARQMWSLAKACRGEVGLVVEVLEGWTVHHRCGAGRTEGVVKPGVEGRDPLADHKNLRCETALKRTVV